MKRLTEQQRINLNNNLEIPHGKKVTITVSDIESSNKILKKTKEAMSFMSELPRKESKEISNKTISAFPQWLNELFDKWEVETENNEYLYSKSFWVWKFQIRSWFWWSSIQNKDGFTIVLFLRRRSNYTELLSLLLMLGVKHTNILIEDDYFGNYYIESLLTQ